MSNKLFEEALADAKKLKEVAEENAKKAILEAVTPRIREFIEDQLLESDEEADDSQQEEADFEEGEEDVVLDESSIASLISMLGGEDVVDSLTEGKGVLNDSISTVLESMNLNEKEKIFNLANKINESADKLSAKRINNNNIQENNQMRKEKFYEVDLKALRESIEEEMSDMAEGDHQYDLDEEVEDSDELGEMDDAELQEMLSEIKLMLDLGEDIEEDQIPEELRGMLLSDEDEEEPLEMGEEDPLMDDMPEEDSEEPEEESEESEMGEEIPGLEDLQETFEIDPRMLRQELARVRRQLKEGKMDHHFGGKGGSSAGVDGAFGGKGKKNVGVKNAFGGGSEGQDPFVNPPQINKLNEAIRNLRRKNRSQAEKLNKYRSAVVTLREQLEDLNLFNAKLLYVNKILNNGSLTESQKKSVVKALDEARSLEETKSLFKSLTETLSTSKKATLNEAKRFGGSSKTTTSSGKVNTKSAGEVTRWQRLAGLK